MGVSPQTASYFPAGRTFRFWRVSRSVQEPFFFHILPPPYLPGSSIKGGHRHTLWSSHTPNSYTLLSRSRSQSERLVALQYRGALLFVISILSLSLSFRFPVSQLQRFIGVLSFLSAHFLILWTTKPVYIIVSTSLCTETEGVRYIEKRFKEQKFRIVQSFLDLFFISKPTLFLLSTLYIYT